ncbi:MAG: hypothetical protein KatS3mg052_2085 [Candidatus Roseilinea sp.]|nr:MAG: hypothetical protein KatS3mg052_2085 [Candidatus Roseilinea sp.]
MYRKLHQTADQIEAVLRERKAPVAVVGGKVLPGFVEMLLRPCAGDEGEPGPSPPGRSGPCPG